VSEIERVWPIEGARVVTFDYDAAETALAAVTTRLPTVVGDQTGARTTAADDARLDWSGYYRTEFDRAEENLATRFETLVAYGPLGLRGEIMGAVGRANDRQREYNADRQAVIDAEAEEAESEEVPAGSTP
jgi:hypothetical protein